VAIRYSSCVCLTMQGAIPIVARRRGSRHIGKSQENDGIAEG
jgi:hypothetical protein